MVGCDDDAHATAADDAFHAEFARQTVDMCVVTQTYLIVHRRLRREQFGSRGENWQCWSTAPSSSLVHCRSVLNVEPSLRHSHDAASVLCLPKLAKAAEYVQHHISPGDPRITCTSRT